MFWKTSEKKTYPGYPDLPGSLRPGALLAIEEAEILRYSGQDITMPLPEGDLVVEAVSSMDLFDLKIARAYAKTGDTQVMFQFNSQADGTLLDVNCFQIYQEIFPESEADWETWIGQGGLIGGRDLSAPNGKTYQRDWGDADWAEPVEAEEKLFVDPGQPPHIVRHKMMLYSRDLEDAREFALVSADEENGQALVRALIGVVMNSMALKVY
ncbi:hypothetical protein JCM15519_18330 [Fundidesulfovibrio butyratiphilus]